MGKQTECVERNAFRMVHSFIEVINLHRCDKIINLLLHQLLSWWVVEKDWFTHFTIDNLCYGAAITISYLEASKLLLLISNNWNMNTGYNSPQLQIVKAVSVVMTKSVEIFLNIQNWMYSHSTILYILHTGRNMILKFHNLIHAM